MKFLFKSALAPLAVMAALVSFTACKKSDDSSSTVTGGQTCQVATATSHSAAVAFSYDAAGNLTKVTETDSGSLTPTSTLTYTYSPDGKTITCTGNNGHQTRITTATVEAGHIIKEVIVKPGVTDEDTAIYFYSYNSLGQLTRKIEGYQYKKPFVARDTTDLTWTNGNMTSMKLRDSTVTIAYNTTPDKMGYFGMISSAFGFEFLGGAAPFSMYGVKNTNLMASVSQTGVVLGTATYELDANGYITKQTINSPFQNIGTQKGTFTYTGCK